MEDVLYHEGYLGFTDRFCARLPIRKVKLNSASLLFFFGA